MRKHKITPGGYGEMETKRHQELIKKKNTESCRITSKKEKL